MRFKIVYSLLPNLPQFTSMSAYARYEGCTISAIKFSIGSIKNRLINISTEDDIRTMEEINQKINEQKLKDNK